MTVAAFVADENDATSLIPWAFRLARINHTDVVVICPRRSRGKSGWFEVEFGGPDENPLHAAIRDAVLSEEQNEPVIGPATGTEEVETGDEPDRIASQVGEIVAPDPHRYFAAEVNRQDYSLLLIAAHEPSKTSGQNQDCAELVLRQAACETMIVRGGPPKHDQPPTIRVVMQGTEDTDAALIRARQLAGDRPDKIEILFVSTQAEHLADDRFMELEVAKRQFNRQLQNMTVDTSSMNTKLVIDDRFLVAIEKRQQEHPVELVMLGGRNTKSIRRLLHPTDSTGPPREYSLIVVRRAEPMVQQIWRSFRDWIRQKTPQLDRRGRVQLVEKLQTSSKFDFDFVVLISLSTLIAALGLIRNSSSVVIGAMLVAPLMTPLVAIGFALVQGNGKLIRNALRSVWLGFALAFGLAVLTGLLVPGIVVQSEMSSRGAPNLLDLVVALLSGMAAAYAIGRPNLISALPGVAIAAALVPPVTTSGISLSLWLESLIWTSGENVISQRQDLTIGAMLLFLTNIVAIVLGTALVFWAVGINSRVGRQQQEGQDLRVWPRYVFLALVIISFVLAAVMTWRNGIHLSAL